ncbi:MAG: hypothetical protein U0R19_24560 [Bryobacteraceae bacterium]
MHRLILITLAATLAAQDIAVVEKKAGMVAFYDANGKRTGEIKVGSHPHELMFSPDRKFLYVSDNGMLWMTDKGEGWNTISIIDVAARKKAGIIDLGNYRRPHGMDLNPKTGQIISTIENPYGLLLIDPAARKVIRKFDVQGTSPHMAIFGPRHETAWVSNSGTGTLAIVTLATGAVKLIPVGKNPQGAVMTRDQKLVYLTISQENRIAIIDTAKQAIIGNIPTAGAPARLALTPDEKMLVYNWQEDAVAFADIASRKELAHAKLPGRPLSLYLSRDGKRAYLGIQDSDKIAIADVATRKVVKLFDTPKNHGPDTIVEVP